MTGIGDDPLDILIVEDNKDSSVGLARLLGGLCLFRIAVAADAAEAVAIIRARRPRSLLTDLNLSGGGTGLDVIRAFRAAGLTGRAVAYTGYSDDKTRRDAADAGADDFIVKPATCSDVLAALRLSAPPSCEPIG